MYAQGMAGTLITTLLFQAIALVWWACESYKGKTMAQLIGLSSSSDSPRSLESSATGLTKHTTSVQRFSSFITRRQASEECAVPVQALEFGLLDSREREHPHF
jgi:hypothetical protein